LREALALELPGDVEPERAYLAEARERLLGDPAGVLGLALVVPAGELVEGRDDPTHAALLLLIGAGVGEHHVAVDLAQEQRLGEGRDGLRGGGAVVGARRCGGHAEQPGRIAAG
jgi:hypothetical protein